VSVSAVDSAAGSRRGVAAWVSSHRALTAAAAGWIFFAVNFNFFSLDYVTDAGRPYAFVQRLFGDAHSADAYQFGLGLAEAPFYALGKLFTSAGIHSVGGKPVLPGFVAISASVFVLAAAAVVLPVLTGLRLPRPTLVLVCAVFGTPFFYYGTFAPGNTHAFETLLFSVVVLLLYLLLQRAGSAPRLALGIGLVVSFSIAVRYFTAAEAVALVAGLCWYRRWRDAAIVAAAPVVGLGVPALAAYLLVGAPLKGAAGPQASSLGSALGVLDFAPLNPLRMLFTDHRGMFVWSPVTVLALVGFAVLLRRSRSERPFLVISGLMGVAIVVSYVFSPFWDGGLAFGQRYFTILVPLVAIGLGGALEWRPGRAEAAAIVLTAWTVCLGLYAGLGFGYDEHHGASQVPKAVVHGHVTPGLIAYNLYRVANLSFVIPDPYH
jgi:hypothetical protein